MALFNDPAEHWANPPSTWLTVRVGRRWELRTLGGTTLQSFARKRVAQAAKTAGPLAVLYADETRWLAGEQVRNWKPYTLPADVGPHRTISSHERATPAATGFSREDRAR